MDQIDFESLPEASGAFFASLNRWVAVWASVDQPSQYRWPPVIAEPQSLF
jgi:hypothetical protein